MLFVFLFFIFDLFVEDNQPVMAYGIAGFEAVAGDVDAVFSRGGGLDGHQRRLLGVGIRFLELPGVARLEVDLDVDVGHAVVAKGEDLVGPAGRQGAVDRFCRMQEVHLDMDDFLFIDILDEFDIVGHLLGHLLHGGLDVLDEQDAVPVESALGVFADADAFRALGQLGEVHVEPEALAGLDSVFLVERHTISGAVAAHHTPFGDVVLGSGGGAQRRPLAYGDADVAMILRSGVGDDDLGLAVPHGDALDGHLAQLASVGRLDVRIAEALHIIGGIPLRIRGSRHREGEKQPRYQREQQSKMYIFTYHN